MKHVFIAGKCLPCKNRENFQLKQAENHLVPIEAGNSYST
ncbi:hypothetical protein TevJSym_bk00060 [endosymbiont of Tevnia jerichonana (vent Tica)]|uniref:Uncharacterized protein n=1 Tax=endosymbiont of Tevnia jerichonana (vent Tica) TaxID=1049564 RepID=G2FJ58_9GAMM|nr:hypothetical protein TevJSym_bk00060 [endosymbiont of Tevnia jerichonana (vent Tica)]